MRFFFGLSLLIAVMANSYINHRVYSQSNAFYGHNFTDLYGKHHKMSEYRGKVVLITNSATLDVFSPQFFEFEWLWGNYSDKLQVLAFPSNMYSLELPTNKKIAEQLKTAWNVTFTVAQRQEKLHPIFDHLKKYDNKSIPIAWNFIKYAIDKTGQLRHRWDQAAKPLTFKPILKKLMQEDEENLIAERLKHERDPQVIWQRGKKAVKDARRQFTMLLGKAFLKYYGAK